MIAPAIADETGWSATSVVAAFTGSQLVAVGVGLVVGHWVGCRARLPPLRARDDGQHPLDVGSELLSEIADEGGRGLLSDFPVVGEESPLEADVRSGAVICRAFQKLGAAEQGLLSNGGGDLPGRGTIPTHC